MSKPDGGPAFPKPDTPPAFVQAGNQSTQTFFCQGSSGMSLRDYFAGEALNGLVAFQYGEELGRIFDRDKAIANAGDDKEFPQTYTARIAYSLADAMLAERDK